MAAEMSIERRRPRDAPPTQLVIGGIKHVVGGALVEKYHTDEMMLAAPDRNHGAVKSQRYLCGA